MPDTPRAWNREADRLAAESIARDDPTGWFERLYAGARTGEVQMPWDRGEPHPLLARWTASTRPDGAGRTAVVVGCGLGADAEHLASLGYAVTGFDIADSALLEVRDRRPDSPVDYQVADLLDLPEAWRDHYDLVVETYTVQAMPRSLRAAATEAVRTLVAPGGTLYAVTAVLADGDDPDEGPPWPLTTAELDALAAPPLAVVRRAVAPHPTDGSFTLAQLELRRPA